MDQIHIEVDSGQKAGHDAFVYVISVGIYKWLHCYFASLNRSKLHNVPNSG